MKINRLLFFVLLLAGFETARAQLAVTTGGDYFSTVNGSMSITIGEPVTETFTGTTNILTQGFQQSRLKALGIYERPDSPFDISVFPNPVKDYVKIKIENYINEKFSYTLSDFQGKLLEHQSIEPSGTEISFHLYAPSIYFLRIYAFDTLTGTFKIVKQ